MWKMSVVIQICSLVYFHSIEALKDNIEVQIFQGFIFTPFQRHW